MDRIVDINSKQNSKTFFSPEYAFFASYIEKMFSVEVSRKSTKRTDIFCLVFVASIASFIVREEQHLRIS